MKVPLKIKIFGWYLRRGIILSKDNLAKRNWQVSTKYVFCHHDENIKYLSFECQFAIQVASNLNPSRSVANIFGNWLHGIDRMFRKHIWMGAIALLWSLWLCRNDRVFNAKVSFPIQVIFRCAHYLRGWSILHSPAHVAHVYRGFLAVGACGDRYFFPSWMAA